MEGEKTYKAVDKSLKKIERNVGLEPKGLASDRESGNTKYNILELL